PVNIPHFRKAVCMHSISAGVELGLDMITWNESNSRLENCFCCFDTSECRILASMFDEEQAELDRLPRELRSLVSLLVELVSTALSLPADIGSLVAKARVISSSTSSPTFTSSSSSLDSA